MDCRDHAYEVLERSKNLIKYLTKGHLCDYFLNQDLVIANKSGAEESVVINQKINATEEKPFVLHWDNGILVS